MQDGSGISLESNVGDVMISNFFDKHSEPPLIRSHSELLCVEALLRCICCQAQLKEAFDWSAVRAERFGFSYWSFALTKAAHVDHYNMSMRKLLWKRRF